MNINNLRCISRVNSHKLGGIIISDSSIINGSYVSLLFVYGSPISFYEYLCSDKGLLSFYLAVAHNIILKTSGIQKIYIHPIHIWAISSDDPRIVGVDINIELDYRMKPCERIFY